MEEIRRKEVRKHASIVVQFRSIWGVVVRGWGCLKWSMTR